MKKLCLLSSILVSSCATSTIKNGNSILGIYTNYEPSIIDQVLIEKSLHGHVFPLPVSLIYLRSDSTYVMGYCDNQIRETGRFSVFKDSVLLYDRFHLVKKEIISERMMYYNVHDKILYYTSFDTNSKYKKYPNAIIPLKKDWDYAHYGFLRGQEMSMDSILQYYKQESVAFQQAWSDSVKRTILK
ncbi:MAG: hypothetical protein JNM21_10470 [Taibaiella sp.]|nr:hypothetical protein [Taibaiella sp.]